MDVLLSHDEIERIIESRCFQLRLGTQLTISTKCKAAASEGCEDLHGNGIQKCKLLRFTDKTPKSFRRITTVNRNESGFDEGTPQKSIFIKNTCSRLPSVLPDGCCLAALGARGNHRLEYPVSAFSQPW